ncbi:hypothetical protein U1Q18_018303 [Sarracenia purpurea var. burkii]
MRHTENDENFELSSAGSCCNSRSTKYMLLSNSSVCDGLLCDGRRDGVELRWSGGKSSNVDGACRDVAEEDNQSVDRIEESDNELFFSGSTICCGVVSLPRCSEFCCYLWSPLGAIGFCCSIGLLLWLYGVTMGFFHAWLVIQVGAIGWFVAVFFGFPSISAVPFSLMFWNK